MEYRQEFMDLAFDQAFITVRENHGGPFGAVVVKGDSVIGIGKNRVLADKDPTAHAEIVAIRDACRKLGSFDLTGCRLYTTCEPCPMCFSAIYWANIGTVYYCSTRHEAEDSGFKDNSIYKEIAIPQRDREVPFIHVSHPKGEELFREWDKKEDKTVYGMLISPQRHEGTKDE